MSSMILTLRAIDTVNARINKYTLYQFFCKIYLKTARDPTQSGPAVGKMRAIDTVNARIDSLQHIKG